MSDDDKLKKAVSEEVRRATTNCPHDFECPNDGKHPLCPVECIAGDVLFVKADRSLACPHLHSLGFGFLCRCPARQEIHRLNSSENT